MLDGQQRLTSCYRAFFGPAGLEPTPFGRYYFNYGRYVQMTDEERKNVEGSSVENLIEFRTPKEVAKSLADTAAEINAGLFPLDIIFQSPRGTDYSKWLSDFAFLKAKGAKVEFNRYSAVQSDFIRTFVERITGYQVHFEEIKKGTNPDVICTVFETINTTGKRLTVFDLLVARCYPKDVRLRDLLVPFGRNLARRSRSL
ncbi:MAG: GmrSD restriction endonuclease domain-containing protein [Polyangiaceae bacterium]